MVSTIFVFLVLATHSSIQTNSFSVGNKNRVQDKVHNRVLTSRLFAEEEGTAVEDIVAETDVEEAAVEEKSSIEAAAEEAEDKTEEVKEAEEDKPLVLCDIPPASHSMVITNDGPSGGKVTTMTVHLGMPGHPEPLVFQS